MSAQSLTCEFCHKTFNSLSSLNYHKKYTKACLQIQNKNLEFHCEHCSKEFSSLHILQSHLLVCKQKKSTEANSIIQDRDFYKLRTQQLEEQVKEKDFYKLRAQQLEEQIKEHAKEKDFYKLRVLQLEEQVKCLVDQNSKLINNKTNSAPISTTITENSNNTITNSNNTQFNTMFNNLIVFNCNNVVNSIKELITDEHIAELDLNDIQKSMLKDLVLNSINKFTFCTDSKRNIIVTKNATGEQTKTKLDDFLADYIKYGKDEMHNYLDHSHNYINDLVNNDELPDESTWYNFEKTKNQMDEKIKNAYKADDVKKTELFKDIHTHIKTNGTRFKKIK